MKYVLFLCVYFILFNSIAQQNVPESEKEKKKTSIAPGLNNNNVETPPAQEVRKRDDKGYSMDSSNKPSSSESQLNQQRYVSANASFQQSYSSAKKLSSRRSPTHEEQLDLNMRLETMRSTNSSGFEYQLAEYQIGNHDVSKIEFLNEAERLNPNDKEVQLQLTAYHEIIGSTKKNTYLKKLDGSKYFSNDLINYARIVLSSLPQNAVLITHGVDDTYPIWIAQSIQGWRKDISVISLDLLQSDEYRGKLKRQGFQLPTTSFVDTKFLQDFIRMNAQKSLHVSMTVPVPYLRSVQSYLEIEGLSFTTKSADPGSKNLLIYKQLLNELDNVSTPSTEIGKQLQMNYAPMLLVIRNTAEINENKELKKKVEKQLLDIAKSAGKTEQMKKIMK